MRMRSFDNLVFLFFGIALLFCSGGRIASSDASSQLEAAVTLVETSRLGRERPPEASSKLWVKAPNGLFYQAHDLGNLVLMLPSVYVSKGISSLMGGQGGGFEIGLRRMGVALSYCLLSTLASLCFFKLNALYHSPRIAFLLSLTFVFSTIFWPYAKTSWDVMACNCTICAVMLFFVKILESSEERTLDYALAGLMISIAGMFRYSMLPSLVLASIAIMSFRKPGLRSLSIFGGVICLGTTPSFLYNLLRTGNALIPATVSAKFIENKLDGDFLIGFPGLLFAPNRGLFVFAPVYLILFTLPWTWKRLPITARRLTLSLGIPTLFYVFLIAKMQNWGAFGWGPRYLVPVLAILFFPVGMSLCVLWKNHARILSALVMVSVILNLAPVVVNWASVCVGPAANPYVLAPLSHLVTWDTLFKGIQGERIPLRAGVHYTAIQLAGLNFPDLWVARLMERSRSNFILGLALTCTIVFIEFRLLRQLLSRNTTTALSTSIEQRSRLTQGMRK